MVFVKPCIVLTDPVAPAAPIVFVEPVPLPNVLVVPMPVAIVELPEEVNVPVTAAGARNGYTASGIHRHAGVTSYQLGGTAACAPMVVEEPASVPILLVETCVVPMLLTARSAEKLPETDSVPVTAVPVVLTTRLLLPPSEIDV